MIADIVRQAVEQQFPLEHREGVLAEFGSMINRGQYRDLPLPLTEIQLALVYLSDGDPQFIVTREYQQSDWRGLIRAYQRANHLNQLKAQSIDTLLEMLNNSATRFDALSVLETKGSEAVNGTPRLVELLEDSEQLFVTKVLRTLAAIGPPAKGAVPALLRLATDDDSLIRLYAHRALKAIGTA
jgi:hypothetical protein